jgi:hypothetical protein
VTGVAAVAIVSGLLGGSALVLAYREGPVPAVTGGFGEPTCQKCHFDNPLNDRQGSLRVQGVPKTYRPGRDYPLTVIVRRAGLSRAGFEMSARFAADVTESGAGAQAGHFRTLDPRLQIVTEPGKAVEYIQHTKAGSDPARAGEARWTLVWTAPPTPKAPVQFDIAANASNNDNSPLGDFIYSATLTAAAAGQSRRP